MHRCVLTNGAACAAMNATEMRMAIVIAQVAAVRVNIAKAWGKCNDKVNARTECVHTDKSTATL